MALTMTRTRTQTTLTRLATVLANLNGELEFVTVLVTEMPAHQKVLAARRDVLLSDRDAVHATLRQFDPEVDWSSIGNASEWMRGIGARNTRTRAAKYLKRLLQPSSCSCYRRVSDRAIGKP